MKINKLKLLIGSSQLMRVGVGDKAQQLAAAWNTFLKDLLGIAFHDSKHLYLFKNFLSFESM